MSFNILGTYCEAWNAAVSLIYRGYRKKVPWILLKGT